MRRWRWWFTMLAVVGVEFACASQLHGMWQGVSLVLAGVGVGAATVMASVDHQDSRGRR